MSDKKRRREEREDRHDKKRLKDCKKEKEKEKYQYRSHTVKLSQEVQKIKHVETFYEKPPPGLIKEDDEKPEDCIPDDPGNEDARDFLAHAPTKGLWMPLGKEVKVMQCWRCKRYGHRTGDKECPFFIKGNQKLEQFRVAHEDPMYDIIRENKRNEKETSILVRTTQRERLVRTAHSSASCGPIGRQGTNQRAEEKGGSESDRRCAVWRRDAGEGAQEERVETLQLRDRTVPQTPRQFLRPRKRTPLAVTVFRLRLIRFFSRDESCHACNYRLSINYGEKTGANGGVGVTASRAKEEERLLEL
ncbi:retinitis pigmentosa 9 protein isoform X1 [Silurus meridionalis]|nr:retinitis pigmentosa 9 protein isoform X1 [Silurus meridionalis]